MRRNLIIAAAFVMGSAAVACGQAPGGSQGSTLGPVPTSVPSSPTSATGGTGTTINGGSGTPIPTTSPGVAGSVTAGTATLTLTGDVQTTQSLVLVSPAIYAPPPGVFALGWSTAASTMAMSGNTFTGTQPTATSLQLTFSVHASSGTLSFSSADGSCQITVTQAEPTAFAGTFACASIQDVSATGTVSVQGSFSATG